MNRPRKGDEARIKFRDHGEGLDDGEILECVVWGYVASAKGACYEIESWRLPKDAETNKDNRKKFTILKSTVIEAVIMVPEESK